MDNMKYCPYCGSSLISGLTSERNMHKEIIEAEYKEGKFAELMQRACNEDDVLAKYYCILYAEREGNQTFILSSKSIFDDKQIQKVNRANPFFGTCVRIFYNHKGGDSADIVKEFFESAKQEEIVAMTFVAEWLMYGQRGLARNPQKAYQYIKTASEKKYPPALYLRGLWHYRGGGEISKNEELGFKLIEEAAYYGHLGAIKLLSKNVINWRSEELKHDVEEDVFVEISNLLKQPKEKLCMPTGYDVDELLDNPQMAELYGGESEEFIEEKERVWSRIYKCKTAEEYDDLYEEIRKEEYQHYDIIPVLNWLIAAIETITGAPFIDRETRMQRQKEAEMFALNVEKAKALIDSYVKIEQFTNLREDLDKHNIVLKKEDKEKIYAYASEKIFKNHEDDIKVYRTYLSSRDEIKAYGGMIIVGVILSIVAIFISPIVMVIVAIVFAIIIGRQIMLNKHAERRMSETYQIYNELDNIRKIYDIYF